MNISLVFATAVSGCSIFALAAFGFSSQAQAFTITGSADGVWSNPILDEANLCLKTPNHPECAKMVQGVGTNKFSWGTVAKISATQKPNELTFTGNSFSADFGSWFKVGSLKYFNAINYADTNVKNVTLNLDLSFDTDQKPVNKLLPVNFNLVNTPNPPKPKNIQELKDLAYSDRVEFATPLPTAKITYHLDTFLVEIFGFGKPTFFSPPQTTISAVEDDYAKNQYGIEHEIYARVSYAGKPDSVPPTNNVPEPSTVAGSLLAGMYLLYRKNFSKQKAKSSCG
ncbi:peptidase-like protein [Calothrix brevissima NIES-22]|nr:peptidase-like protein [Calothrix brevissima NIES-22]